ncbi:MAG: restriction endonuclease subunit M [Anaerolineae bacterium]
MNLDELKSTLDQLAESLRDEQKDLLTARLDALTSAYPFNEFEYILTFLINEGVITFDEYERLRTNYVNENRYLDLFGLAPRIFGQVWGEKHLIDLDNRFTKPTKSLDPDYDGQYDLWIEGIRVEVKASRAINTKKKGPLSSKALRQNSNEPFWMNFQQLKLDLCDVFVFIVVWVNQIEYWVLSNEEVKKNPYLSKQHRGGIEYQIGFRNKNIAEFDPHKVKANAIGDTVIMKGRS